MRVLIVDDEVLIRNWLDSACAEYGILPEDRVLAANGKDALAKMSGRDFDLIFTDITMPGMSGLEFVEKLKEQGNSIPIIILSCHNDFEYARAAIRLGCADYLMKSELAKEDVFTILDKHAADKDRHEVHSISVLPSDMKAFILGDGNHPVSISFPFRRWGMVMILSDSFTLSRITFDGIASIGSCFVFTYDEGIPCYILEILDDHISSLEFAKLVHRILARAGLEKDRVAVSSISSGEETLVNAFRSILRITAAYYFDVATPRVGDDNAALVLRFSSQLDEMLQNARMSSSLSVIQSIVDQFFAMVYSSGIFDMLFCRKFLAGICDCIGMHVTAGESPAFKAEAVRIQASSSFSEARRLLEEVMKRFLAGSSASEYIKTAKDYILMNYYRQCSLADVAANVNISEEYLSRLFRKETGKSFVEFLTEVRMRKAKSLLLRSNCSMSEICDMVGIQSQTYFSTLFRKYYGMTPSDLRKSAKAE